MNAILGMTALTLKSDLPEQERNYLLKVQDAAKSLLGLLNDILDYSKAEAGMVEFEHIPFTLDEVLANSFLAVQSQAASRRLMLLNEIAPGHSNQLGQRLVGDPSTHTSPASQRARPQPTTSVAPQTTCSQLPQMRPAGALQALLA